MVDPSLRHGGGAYRRTKPYIVGYSGYIPGMNHRYGQTFGKAAEDCVAIFLKQQQQRQVRAQAEERRAKSLPRYMSAGQRFVAREESFISKYGVDGRGNPKYPPLPGYTGYIPLMKATDIGIGRTFSASAKKGYNIVHKDRERRSAHHQKK